MSPCTKMKVSRESEQWLQVILPLGEIGVLGCMIRYSWIQTHNYVPSLDPLGYLMSLYVVHLNDAGFNLVPILTPNK